MPARNRITIWICVGLLCVFTGLSWSAVETKNATIDEPVQSMSGWMQLRYHDFRLVPESAPLAQLWAALPNGWQNPKVRFDSHVWSDCSFDSQDGINWTYRTLYQTPGNDGETFVRRSRSMMLAVGIGLGGMIAWWSFRLAGSMAAVVAGGLFSLDPNMLAHAPIVKGDVSLALVMLSLSYALWQTGRVGTVARVIGIGVLCGAAVATKFSGLLTLPIVAAVLLVRAMLPYPWQWTSVSLLTVRRRLTAVVVSCAVVGAVTVAIIWATYGFRFRPAPSRSSKIDMVAIRHRAMALETAASVATHDPSPAEVSAHQPGLIVRAIDLADRYQLLPQAMLGGLLYQHACMQIWPSFLMGRLYGIGRWYYFPLAMVFKTPLATLVAVCCSVVLIPTMWRRHRRQSTATTPDSIASSISWSAVCLVIPFTMFAAASMSSNLDIGLRNVLPLYPLLFVGCGVMAAAAIKRWRRPAVIFCGTLLVLLFVESLSAWPDYIPFFNVVFGGKRGGFALLGDSNLDWGQDIKALADWQKLNPDIPLYLHCFASVDPAGFGLKYHRFDLSADGSQLICDVPLKAGVIAVSTNYLQGLYCGPNDREFFRQLGQTPPATIIGGSIYLYRYPLR